MSLERRTPLGRGKPIERGTASLKRSEMRRGQPMQRTAMRSTPTKAAHSASYWEAVIIPGLMQRCRGRCEVTGVGLDAGRWSVHHRRPRGMGGTSAADVDDWSNLLVVTGDGTTGVHGWIEAYRSAARGRGLLVRQGHDPSEVPVTLYSGRRVLLSATAPIYLPAPGEPYALEMHKIL